MVCIYLSSKIPSNGRYNRMRGFFRFNSSQLTLWGLVQGDQTQWALGGGGGFKRKRDQKRKVEIMENNLST